MVEYIIRTDEPMRFDVYLNLKGIHNYSVQRLGKHGDLVDRDSVATTMRDYLLNHFGEKLDEDLSNAIYALIAEAEVVLERTT